ncbi:MAG: hypothetical protein K2O61_03305, partial [Bacteroidaceae bacterium]|nr:hypothetical protein [Bacteroidaceae bacterium]
MRRNLQRLMVVLAAMVSCLGANAIDKVVKQAEMKGEITSVEDLAESMFMLQNGEGDGAVVLYTPDGWDIKVAPLVTAAGKADNGGFYKLETFDTHYLIPVYNIDKSRRTFWAGEQYVNSQPTGGNVIFGLSGTNDQHGQDGPNLALWDITYEEGQGFAFHCVGRDVYIGHDGTAARPSENIVYWKAYTSYILGYDPDEAAAAYNEALAAAKSVDTKAALAAAAEAYASDNNIEKYGDAVNDVIDAINNELAIIAKCQNLAEAAEVLNKYNAGEYKNAEELLIDYISAVKAQSTAGANMTDAITNPSFETGNTDGWVNNGFAIAPNTDFPLISGVKYAERWTWAATVENSKITQEITGLPNGIYEVSAAMRLIAQSEGDADKTGLFLLANDEKVAVEATGVIKATVEVTDGVLVIGAEISEAQGNWANIDDFKLTFEGAPATEDDMAPIVAEKAIAEALGVDVSAYGNQPIAAASVESVVNALKVAEYAQVHADYTQNAASLIPDFAQWEGDMVSNKGQHWDGTGTSTYYEQTGAQWGQDNWTNNKKTTVNLPKGKYVLYAAGRASAGTACTAYIKVNDEVREFPSKGDVGFGVATDGAAAFDPATATFANGNNGRGWEYRYIAFEVTADEGEDIALEIGGEATANHQWMSITTPVLLTTADNAAIAKQILAADIEIAQAIVEAKAGVGEGLFMIPAEAFETFEAAVNDAKGVNDNAEATAEDINAAIDALAAATEAYHSTPVNTPDPEKQYTFQLKLDDETPLYMNLSDGIKIQEEATPLSFVAAATAGQYNLVAEDELYVGLAGGNAWTMSTAAEQKAAWTFTALGNGEYNINNLVTAGRFVGTNAAEKTAGSPCYADKLPSNGNVVWIIEEYVVAVPTFAGIIEQTLTHPAQGVMGTETSEQTVKIAEAGEGLVDITFSGFKFPVLPFTVPEFTISNVAAETADDGSITYAAGNFQVEVPSGMMSAYYNGTLEGVQASAEATPLFKLVISNATTDEVYFGADQDAIDAYKASFEPEPELAWVDLTDDMYHEWTGVDANAEITSNAPAFEKNIGNEVGGGTTVYGNGSVAAKTYAALADYKALKVTRSNETGGVPRLLFGRSEDNSQDFIEIADVQSPYIKATEDDGLTWIIDLDKIKAEKDGLANLNVIKVSWGGAATITSIQLGKVAEEEVPEIAISVERIVNQGYAAQTESIDFTEVAELLGVDAITEDMLRVVEADGTLNSDIAKYDGWFNKDGYAQTWGDNSFVCVKLFQAIEDGKYEICDMNNPQVDDEVTAKWAVVNGEKTVYININVKFIKKPVVGPTFDELNKLGDDVVVSFTSECGKSYEGLSRNVNMA